MKIRPARLAAMLLGKRRSPLLETGSRIAFRLLRMAGAEIEMVFEQAAQSGGSILWLEDYFEELDSNSENPYIPALFKVIAEHTWLWFNDDGKVSKDEARKFLIAYINKEILELPYQLDSGFGFFKNEQLSSGSPVNITNNNIQANGDNSPLAVSSGSGSASSSVSHFNYSYEACKAQLITGLNDLLSNLSNDYHKDMVVDLLAQLKNARNQADKEGAMCALGGLLITLKELSGAGAEIVKNLIVVATPVLKCIDGAQPYLEAFFK